MEDKELIAAAKKYREFSYSPYSKFKVGAAVLTKKGNVYGGCNVENSSFPMTNCAERTAIFKAVSEGEREFEAIALIADTPEPCSPCGACRQVMVEFKIPKIIMANMKGDVQVVTLEELMPYAFTEF
ncbi:cytidine deaminase [Selenomonas ruminantium]|uniref:Cytidine deaminase n=1 Tax=Selenomonas ruminantium TaxID=971 RepID=A0A1H0VD12_SELRU|nr:cytidine deaminase [Selenomonas ruminantium]SDP75976.1 cytidine deaminase [Selenomonas ruminantium]